MVYRILSLDGGGIRGVISATILQIIEQRLKKLGKSGLSDYFHMFVGTSTGSILAAAIANQIDSSKIVELYQTRGQSIFPYQSRWSPQRIGLVLQHGISAPKYPNTGLIKVLKKELGVDKKFSQINDAKRLLITSYDTITRHPIIFDSLDKQFSSVPLWEACVCSSSAPTFFPAYRLIIDNKEFSAIDGGVVANNPTALGIAKAVNTGLSLDEIQVLSVGTGDPTRPIPYEDAKEWGALEWAAPIIDVMFDGGSDINSYIVKYVIGNSRYLRIQFRLDSDEVGNGTRLSDDIDDASPSNINSLIEAAKYIMEGSMGDRLASFLKL